MASRHEQEVDLVDNFISTKGPQFHSAFGVPSELNRSMMSYERPEVRDLRETLECHQQKGKKYVDFTHDLTNCTWDQVHEELRKAQAKAEESENRGRHPVINVWRKMGVSSSVLAPGLEAIPDNLCMLHGGLAVIFSVRSGLDSIPRIIS
jgi:hypothetical protein